MLVTHLQNFLSESLRMYPSFSANLRICSKKFNFSNFIVPEGKTVIIPVCGFHRDPIYFPEPNKFDPERFNSEKSRQPFTYLPFGIGQRACIGNLSFVFLIRL